MSIPTKPSRPRPRDGSGERPRRLLCEWCDRPVLSMGIVRGREHFYCDSCETVRPMPAPSAQGGGR